jgi:hypothetical protein
LTSIENQFYIELHNFNFIYTQANSTSTKYTKEKLPWASKPETSMASSNSLARAIHQKAQEQQSAITQEKHEIKRKFHPNKIAKSADKSQEILDNKQEILSDNPQEILLDDPQEISDSEEVQETLEETEEQKSTLGKRKTRTKKETLEETQEPKFALRKYKTRVKKETN